MSITVSRTVVVRVHHQLDSIGCQQLDRILSDLIGSQGVTDLIVDLSKAGAVAPEVREVLDLAREAMEFVNGSMEIRIPTESSHEVRDLAEEVRVFIPVDPIRADPGSPSSTDRDPRRGSE